MMSTKKNPVVSGDFLLFFHLNEESFLHEDLPGAALSPASEREPEPGSGKVSDLIGMDDRLRSEKCGAVLNSP